MNTRLDSRSAIPNLAGGCVTIDLDALTRNWRALNALSGKAGTAAVVKANAYGLGIEPVVEALVASGCRVFFVALVEEGIRVKKIAPDRDVYVLNGLWEEAISIMSETGLIPVLGSLDELQLWSQYWQKRGPPKPCAIHVDTGMNRLGLQVNEATRFFADEFEGFPIKPTLIISHLACADEPENFLNRTQLQAFKPLADRFMNVPLSLANSAGIFLGSDYHFNLVRSGIALYGGEAINDVPNPMEPVVTLEARIVQIKTVKKGESVGYGGAHCCKRDSKIAITTIGYADGYHRAGFDGGFDNARGAIGGHIVPVAGRISMDLTAFDVTGIPENILGKYGWIELFGKTILLDSAARAAGTIGNELLTSLGTRYWRRIMGGPSRENRNG